MSNPTEPCMSKSISLLPKILSKKLELTYKSGSKPRLLISSFSSSRIEICSLK